MKEILSIDVVLQLFAWVSLSSLNAIYFQSNFTFWWQSFYYFLLCFLATKTWRKNRTKYIGRLKLPVELQVYGKISSANIPLSTLLPSWLGVRVHFLFSEKYHLQTSVSALYYLADWHPHPQALQILHKLAWCWDVYYHLDFSGVKSELLTSALCYQADWGSESTSFSQKNITCRLPFQRYITLLIDIPTLRHYKFCINWLGVGMFTITWTSAESNRNYWLQHFVTKLIGGQSPLPFLRKISPADFRFSAILPCWLTSPPSGTTNFA